MLSEDFALSGTNKLEWKEFYNNEVVQQEQYKTLLISYRGQFYQYEPIGYEEGKSFNGKKIVANSYLFLHFETKEKYDLAFNQAICFDNFKEAVDKSEILPGKTLKDIWDDPNSEYIDFM